MYGSLRQDLQENILALEKRKTLIDKATAELDKKAHDLKVAEKALRKKIEDQETLYRRSARPL